MSIIWISWDLETHRRQLVFEVLSVNSSHLPALSATIHCRHFVAAARKLWLHTDERKSHISCR